MREIIRNYTMYHFKRQSDILLTLILSILNDAAHLVVKIELATLEVLISLKICKYKVSGDGPVECTASIDRSR